MKRTAHILTLPVCLLALAACEPTIANRGNLIEDDKLAEVKVGETTRAEVADKLGTPTQTGTFDENVWYYYGRQTKQYAFWDPEIVAQKAVEIRFDDQGTVVAVNKIDPSISRDDIDPVGRVTPTYGHELTFMEQLVGNIGHPRMGGNDKK
jgi:outer membrane protein assembly factor BamE (lipoprotein component of BamABCDE complex)